MKRKEVNRQWYSKGMGNEIIIRAITAADIPAMVAITSEVFGCASMDRMAEQAVGPAAAPWQRIKGQVVANEAASNPGGCFVAEMGGRIVGYVTTVINPLAGRGTIANLAVSAAAQGKGVGRKLIQRSLDHFRSQGLVQARIDTLESNEVGKHLYPDMGFEEVVREIHYFMRL